MELRQLRALVCLRENKFSVSKTAERLHLVQSAVSQQITRLEDELGIALFVRHGKRLTGLTSAGEDICRFAYQTLASVSSIEEISREHLQRERSTLRIGATHTQARYVLPRVIKRFRDEFPQVEVQIHQGTPKQLVERLLQNVVDLSICTEAVENHSELVSIPCYRWNRVLIALPGHPLLDEEPMTLEALARHPVITYVYGFTGRGVFDETFARHHLEPWVVISAADTDVIKTYVREGLGVGVIASIACMAQIDSDLRTRDLAHLFPAEHTKIAYQKNRYLPRPQQRFIELFQEHVDSLSSVSDVGRVCERRE